MDALEAIMTRRSIRRFSDAKVKDSELESVLRAAMAAPSAGNQQPWRFVVVRDRATLEAMASASPYAAFLPDAAVAIVVCGDEGSQKHVGFWVQDCAIATTHMLLAAHAIGLGAVWLGYYPVKERVRGVADALHLPEGITPFSIVALGHPAEVKEPADRWDPTKVHHGGW